MLGKEISSQLIGIATIAIEPVIILPCPEDRAQPPVTRITPRADRK